MAACVLHAHRRREPGAQSGWAYPAAHGPAAFACSSRPVPACSGRKCPRRLARPWPAGWDEVSSKHLQCIACGAPKAVKAKCMESSGVAESAERPRALRKVHAPAGYTGCLAARWHPAQKRPMGAVHWRRLSWRLTEKLHAHVRIAPESMGLCHRLDAGAHESESGSACICVSTAGIRSAFRPSHGSHADRSRDARPRSSSSSG